MKLVLFVSCCVLLLREGSLWSYTTPGGPGVSLKGKMVTLTQYSGVTFYPLQYNPSGHTTQDYPTSADPTTRDYSTTGGPTKNSTTRDYSTTATTPTKTATTTSQTTTTTTTTTTITTTTTTPKTTTTITTTTTTPKTTTPSYTRGVSVCLRFMTDSDSLTLFRLSPGSPLVLTRSLSGFYNFRQNYPGVYLRPNVFLWSSVAPQSWTSVCLTLDSDKNVVQVFEGGFMSIRKILPTQVLWSREPVLDVSGFDGHVTDLEVWDYPLEYRQIYSYMQDYGPSGSVLTWSRIRYQMNGRVLLEDTFNRRVRQPIRGKGRVQRFKHGKHFDEKKSKREDRL